MGGGRTGEMREAEAYKEGGRGARGGGGRRRDRGRREEGGLGKQGWEGLGGERGAHARSRSAALEGPPARARARPTQQQQQQQQHAATARHLAMRLRLKKKKRRRNWLLTCCSDVNETRVLSRALHRYVRTKCMSSWLSNNAQLTELGG
jgi:hypothetical protein